MVATPAIAFAIGSVEPFECRLELAAISVDLCDVIGSIRE